MVGPVTIRRPIGDAAPTATLYYGADCRETLRRLSDASVHCVVTSPPYWGLRDYGTGDAQIGLEKTPEDFVAELVDVFREVRRVLRDDGTLWLNLGDSYAGAGPSGASYQSETTTRREGRRQEGNFTISKTLGDRGLSYKDKKPIPPPGLKSKDLVGVPWMVAFALRADGWYLRSDIIWAKPSCMPESVRDRPTKSHEYLFLLSKSVRYYYDVDAIREPITTAPQGRRTTEAFSDTGRPDHRKASMSYRYDGVAPGNPAGRNKRTVWTVNPRPYPGAHFAVFPPELITPCVLAGTSEKGCCPECGTPRRRVAEGAGGREGGPTGWEVACDCGRDDAVPCTVLDPFSGSGTTGQVALDHGRAYVGIDLSRDYLDLARARLLGERPPRPEPDDDGGILGILSGGDE